MPNLYQGVIDMEISNMRTDKIVSPVTTDAQERDIINHISRLPWFTAEDGIKGFENRIRNFGP